MRWRSATIGLLVASAAWAQPAGDTERAADETVLRDQRLPTKGAELLQILRDRTPTSEAITQFKMHVPRLKAAAYTDRIKATGELTKIGPKVRPLLDNLLLEIKADAETVNRLRQVADRFPIDKDLAATAAAARLIERDRPPGSLGVLLEFVPYAGNEFVRQDVQRAISAVAVIDKKPAPALSAALKDADPARRAAAGEALLRTVGLTKEALAPLLADEHPLVRYQIGMVLVEKHDKRGLPMLVASLADSPADRVEHAIDLLTRVAGEHTPEVYYRGKHDAVKVAAAWKYWYEHAGALDLAKALTRTELGFTVIATGQVSKKGLGGKNKIFEIGPGPEFEVLWEFDGPRSPFDVQVIGPNRLLIAEYYERRVTERDFKGNVHKQFPAQLPIGCQRLSNGQTFIVSRQNLRIVDADGKDLFTWFPESLSITAAQRLRNGQIAVTTTGGTCQLLDPQGRELKGFTIGGSIYSQGGNFEVLSNGRILVPIYNQSTVVEFDWAGNKHWEATVRNPTSVSRLLNGNTLVTCIFDQRVVELDANGKEVWSFETDGRPTRARRR